MLLLFSLIFYAWGAPVFILFVVASLLINFYIVRHMEKVAISSKRRGWAALSIAINLSMLLYFKYANFFMENFNQLLNQFGQTSVSWTKIVLPIGISFFTFQSLTYTVDVYRQVHRSLKHPHEYLLYILMFPQLIAGPIIRFNTVADRIINRSEYETWDNRVLGFFRFVTGLAKKVLVANVLGHYVNDLYSLNPDSIGTSQAWLAAIAYSFQIYFDFSGYSDMAIGIGRMIGFNFPENFDNPYISKSISEFWRRWHITLSTWMKDYLYIPLGGSRVSSKYRLYFNLSIVFIISGFWHGAAWNFIIWGAFHGFFLILDRIFLLKFLKRIPVIISVSLTYIITLIGWVIFRVESLKDMGGFLKAMFIFKKNSSNFTVNSEFLTILIIGAFFSFLTLTSIGKKMMDFWFYQKPTKFNLGWMSIVIFIMLIVSIASIRSAGFNPFIYFRF